MDFEIESAMVRGSHPSLPVCLPSGMLDKLRTHRTFRVEDMLYALRFRMPSLNRGVKMTSRHCKALRAPDEQLHYESQSSFLARQRLQAVALRPVPLAETIRESPSSLCNKLVDINKQHQKPQPRRLCSIVPLPPWVMCTRTNNSTSHVLNYKYQPSSESLYLKDQASLMGLDVLEVFPVHSPFQHSWQRDVSLISPISGAVPV
ncbi:uncharacterized protein B0I36DRAFT_342483 [Microdochium trichocladiopsis]|uniref:Uncharacterized protein n=1 Tax=Microdochium trichocladiopsis TaxID=1682393 RepID=A0A9P9BI26_9PEZI|nr:uncharacterized protein B0I36DRAFT_342483 [Microdochium trichocladiopsis]KAH7009465.1 hypothetical protein B0I36DRAFT_342483 [Microdochium trichocladiopsis]